MGRFEDDTWILCEETAGLDTVELRYPARLFNLRYPWDTCQGASAHRSPCRKKKSNVEGKCWLQAHTVGRSPKLGMDGHTRGSHLPSASRVADRGDHHSSSPYSQQHAPSLGQLQPMLRDSSSTLSKLRSTIPTTAGGSRKQHGGQGSMKRRGGKENRRKWRTYAHMTLGQRALCFGPHVSLA